MEISISNYKSIKKVRMKLGRVTILLGPPAVGKSNVLEAIALATYFDRYALYVEGAPLSKLIRDSAKHLFYMSKTIDINLYAGEWRRSLRISALGPDLELNNTIVPINTNCLLDTDYLFTYNGQRYCFDKFKIKDLLKASENVLSMLYGFDRFRDDIVNSMLNGAEVEAPQDLLREDGKNFGIVAIRQSEVIKDVNAELAELSQTEVRLLDNGKVVMFSGAAGFAAPESLLRIMYYLVGISSATNYALDGLEGRSIVLLEEPEIHPALLQLLVKHIAKFSEAGYVVITTHNPILVSLLRDKLNVTLYYVYRGDEGYTEVAELNKDKLAEELVTSEDILFMKPRDVHLKR